VPREERHPPGPDGTDRDKGGRRAERGVDCELVDVLEQRVEAGSPIHADVGAACGRRGRGHGLSAAAVDDEDEDEGEDEGEDEDEDEDDDEDEGDDLAPSPFEPEDVDFESDGLDDSDAEPDEDEDLTGFRLSVL